jgi:hypothetical protein
VPAALLLPGRGLAGGGPQPDFDRPFLTALTPADHAPLPPGCDPMVCSLDLDPRPPEYAAQFAAAARRLVLLEDGDPRPPWWELRALVRRRNVRGIGTGRGAPGHREPDGRDTQTPCVHPVEVWFIGGCERRG